MDRGAARVGGSARRAAASIPAAAGGGPQRGGRRGGLRLQLRDRKESATLCALEAARIASGPNMSESDLDSLYKRASKQDGAHPRAAVRPDILEHARRLADQTAQQTAGAAENQLRSSERGRDDRATSSRWSRWVA